MRPPLSTLTALAALLLLGLGPAAGPSPEPLPPLSKGQLIPRVDCPADPRNPGAPPARYALYIPTRYDPARRSPILYILDARGRAELPAKLFQAAAETYGYLLASSYNSASDGPLQPTVNAMQAMWNDTHRRFAVDDRRVYVAGFSGTVRAACFMGLSVPGSIAGVIGAGAGFPYDRPPTRAVPFLFFGTVGDRDFNYDEMMELEDRLTDLHLPHRIEVFPGPHQWMPERLATAALAWLDRRAMKAGLRAADPAEIAARAREDLARAQELEAAGDPVGAFRLYRAMADDDPTFEPAARKAAELGASPKLQAAFREQRAQRKRDRRYLEEAEHTLAAITPDSRPWSLGRTVAELRLPELQKRAGEKGDGADALSARRLLYAVYVQTGFYRPRQALEHQEYALAAFFLELAATIRPAEPAPWYSAAGVHARAGDRPKAFAALRKALELGWTDAEQMERDPDLAALHADPAWPGIVAGVREKAAAGKPEKP
jgi:predicted esterase